MAAGWIVMLVFWALVVVGIVAVVKAATNRQSLSGARRLDNPLDILRRRYAAGELTKEQFEAMKKDIA
jgi:putative membrane protein